ncbi:uncharacterized protein LOC111353434 [Spodoptera litura]|uniref:Uncharacterized protein LOC111353434 n=1 Tax=Spodoptera litura TaxID=69820 RepID=A0A9J7IP56_SPOLT|nr:uncharacterized protein LOC111353434 [Spodoptera litura]
MSSIMILFLAMIAVIGPLQIVDSAPSQVLDINNILEHFKQENIAKAANRLQKNKSDSDSDSLIDDLVDYLDDKTDSDKFDNRNARLTKQKVIDLIESVVNQKKSKSRNNNHRIYRKEKTNRDLNTYENRNDNREILQRNILQNLVIEQLLSRGLKEDEIKEKSKDYLLNGIQPDRVAYYSKGDKFKRRVKNKKPARLEDYSKVVVVLNPQAVRKNGNKKSLNDLISKILSVSSLTSKNNRQAENHIQRRNRQSKERMRARRDSAGDEYNQKRSNRNSVRTAIPYIRHRGDIYEKEE